MALNFRRTKFFSPGLRHFIDCINVEARLPYAILTTSHAQIVCQAGLSQLHYVLIQPSCCCMSCLLLFEFFLGQLDLFGSIVAIIVK